MKNVLTFWNDDFLALENIDSGADIIDILYYLTNANNPSLDINGTSYSFTNLGSGLYKVTVPLSIVNEDNSILTFHLVNGGTAYTNYKLVFYDFDEEGTFHYNLWQKRLQVYQTENAYVFHGYIIALVETETTTVGDGLTVTEKSELKVNTGAGLTTTSDGKVAAIEATRNVSTIDVTESNDKVSSITINYDNETSKSYACSYDSSGNLVGFGNVVINWE